MQLKNGLRSALLRKQFLFGLGDYTTSPIIFGNRMWPFIAPKPVLVQKSSKVQFASSSLTTFSIPLAGVTAGNTLILTASVFDAGNMTFSVSGVNDGGADTFTTITSKADETGFSVRTVAVLAHSIGVTSGNKIVNVVLSGASAGTNRYVILGLEEWANIGAEDTAARLTTSDFDITTNDVSIGPTPTLAKPSNIAFAVNALPGSHTDNHMTSPDGWANDYVEVDENTYIGFSVDSKFTTATTALTAAWSHDNDANHAAAILAVFQLKTIEVPLATLAITGQVPTVVVSNNKLISVPLGTITATALTPTVVASVNNLISVPLGTLTLTGNDPTVIGSSGNVVNVPLGTLAISGQVPTVASTANNSVAVPLGTLSLTGQVPSIVATANNSITPPLGTLSLTANVPTVAATNNNFISVPLGTLALSGKIPVVAATAGNFISVPLATITATALVPTIVQSANKLVSVPAGSLALTGLVPTIQVSNHQRVAVPLGTLAITGQVPSVGVGSNQIVSVPAGSITASAKVPVVAVTANVTVAVPAGAITFTGFAPTVVSSAHKIVAVPSGQLTLTGIAPAVVASQHQVVAVPKGALTVSGFDPSVAITGPVYIQVPLGELSLTTFNCRVLNGDFEGPMFDFGYNIVEVDEEQNIVEIHYQGLHHQMLLTLQAEVDQLELDFANAMNGTNGQLGTLAADINSLSSITQALGNALTDEIALRASSDTLFGEQLHDLNQDLSDAITATTNGWGQAILDEAAARGAAIGSATATIISDLANLTVSVSGMATELGSATASIIDVETALSTEVSARAAQYSAIQADFGDTNAAVLDESLARANADSALAEAISILSVSAAVSTYRQSTPPSGGIVTGSLWFKTDENNRAYRWDGSAWIATDDTRIATNTANITTISSAYAAADTALASSISTLSTTVGAHTTSISTQASSISGIQAKYSLTLDVNGNISGYELIGTGTGSSFKISASDFSVWNGSGTVAPFTVSGGIVYMQNVKINGNLFVSGTITANKFMTDSGVDLAAVVPGSLNTTFSGFSGTPALVAYDGFSTWTSAYMAQTGAIACNGQTALIDFNGLWYGSLNIVALIEFYWSGTGSWGTVRYAPPMLPTTVASGSYIPFTSDGLQPFTLPTTGYGYFRVEFQALSAGSAFVDDVTLNVRLLFMK